jgi:hypothetical protein
MISKIVWPRAFEKGNPFGGVDGFRPIRITFHSSSFANIANDARRALDILIGLAKLVDVDAMSFDGSVSPKIFIDHEKEDEKYIGLKIISAEGEAPRFSGVSKSWLEPSYIADFLGIYSSNEEEKYRSICQEILEAKSHGALHRDIFVTSSAFLLKNKDKLDELNICTPTEALKITGLYLRMKDEFEWTSHIEGKARFITSRETFYEFLSRGMLPNSWMYLSNLGLHNEHEKLISLGWSVLNRYSRALQARDEIGRLFYMPKTSSSEGQMAYHFDYLTLLLAAVLDAQALIINRVYGLGLKDYDCGLRRDKFKNAVKRNPASSNLYAILTTKEDFINILFELRNKIHSVGLKTDFHVPETYPDELLEMMYQYDLNDHWGIQKRNVTVIINRGNPIPSIDYSVDTYNLAHELVHEATKLINSLMEETNIENYLDAGQFSKNLINPPADMLAYIQTYLLLA